MIYAIHGLVGMLKRGMPLNVLRDFGGWESVEMVRRYAHLSGGHLFAYARSMADNLDTVATN